MGNHKKDVIKGSLVFFAAAASFLVAGIANAETTSRSCTYDLIIESSSPSITPQRIYELKATGSFSHSWVQSNPARTARSMAQGAALGCLRASVNSPVQPAECTQPRSNVGTVHVQFRHQNLSQEVRDQVCLTAARQNLGTRIGSYQLRVETRGGTDVRRECNNNQVLIRGTNLICGGGVSASAPETRWSKWYTDKSPAQMPAWIAGYCRNNRNSQNSTINRWEINPNTGALRVHFSCR